MMNDFTSIRMCLCLAIIALCSIISAGQVPEAHKLVEEINTAKSKREDLSIELSRQVPSCRAGSDRDYEEVVK